MSTSHGHYCPGADVQSSDVNKKELKMSTDYASLFAHCGNDVIVENDVHIERPELFDVGTNVRICDGFYCMGAARVTLGSNVTLYPRCFIQGSGELVLADHVDLFPNAYMSTGHSDGRIQVGEGSHVAAGAALYGKYRLTLGRYCNIAANVVLSTVQHDPRIHAQPMARVRSQGGPITIADDVWIGANATVTPNTTIAEGCIIGAGAVLTRDTEPYGIYGGVPARRLRDREAASADDPVVPT
ncbi:acyltransferase [Actinobacteria bacterium YIM 96077]|uniref:Acyltransferase n=1 Tax=Phytoactinopolyspora halophila TaxID=1981511 RepID=A0A329QHZ5_9ACTN|nr:acyltransferase [Phytoactinopolyspora halophila]AYY12429.1 acyltransferase [Actinobacteria bacterium YIM 96077]RAW11993.1 hypothetical protein DPM12_15035 [Phytoactinopolyspora halophila]